MHSSLRSVVVVVVVVAALFGVVTSTPTTPLDVKAYNLPVNYLIERNGQLVVTRSLPMNPVVLAEAQYNASIKDLGWNYLRVNSQWKLATDPGKAYYLGGYMEGYLTHDAIADFVNFTRFDGYLALAKSDPTSVVGKVIAWVNKHITYIESKTSAYYGKDKFWTQVGSHFAQLKGIVDGYNAAPHKHGQHRNLTFTELFLWNFNNELGSVERHVVYAEGGKLDMLSAQREAHCSALIKLTADDLYVAHDTWSGFYAMPGRMFKVYEFQTTVTMTSLAGSIASGDDWYQTSHELVVQETTNGIYNDSLSVYVVPETVSEFIRVMTANFLCTNGEDWTRTFSRENSGTYSNQYMVVDYKKFVPGSTVIRDTLWVVEQIPGFTDRGDMSESLWLYGYWASYNLPYFRKIFDLSGFAAKQAEYGDFFSYNHYARPEIFKRNQSGITQLSDMQRMMRYNNYQYDPLSTIHNCTGAPNNKCETPRTAMLSIASRGDLMTVYPTKQQGINHYGPLYMYMAGHCFGAIDSKIASWNGRRSLEAFVISGPTNDQQPVFSFGSSQCPVLFPSGPTTYDFPWVSFKIYQP